jgi:argonaute-like protein implicated in RNA metabolism and viral defense
LVVGCSALPTEAQLSGVEFFSTYPGMYVPQPLALRHDAGDSAATDLAREVLALTKMNWNNTQFDGRAPITIRPARQVGNILKYVGPDDPVEPRYANYM